MVLYRKRCHGSQRGPNDMADRLWCYHHVHGASHHTVVLGAGSIRGLGPDTRDTLVRAWCQPSRHSFLAASRVSREDTNEVLLRPWCQPWHQSFCQKHNRFWCRFYQLLCLFETLSGISFSSFHVNLFHKNQIWESLLKSNGKRNKVEIST